MAARRIEVRWAGLFAIGLALGCMAWAGEARAQVPAAPGSTAAAEAPLPAAAQPVPPSTTISPPEGTTGAPAAAHAPAVKHAVRRPRLTEEELTVEPGHARLKLKEDAWVYSQPSKFSKHVARVHKGKFINVSGSTKYYLQVQLKTGRTGYVSPSAVQLVSPTDKTFTLTKDTPVLNKPNRWGKKVAEVHRGHGVRVVGIALNYMKIKMKNGLEGYVTMTALE